MSSASTVCLAPWAASRCARPRGVSKRYHANLSPKALTAHWLITLSITTASSVPCGVVWPWRASDYPAEVFSFGVVLLCRISGHSAKVIVSCGVCLLWRMDRFSQVACVCCVVRRRTLHHKWHAVWCVFGRITVSNTAEVWGSRVVYACVGGSLITLRIFNVMACAVFRRLQVCQTGLL